MNDQNRRDIWLPTRYNLKKQAYTSLRSKIKICETCVRPVITYNIETRAETTITKC